jgi:F0F1-type ATP synthase membrane subunit b/b'
MREALEAVRNVDRALDELGAEVDSQVRELEEHVRRRVSELRGRISSLVESERARMMDEMEKDVKAHSEQLRSQSAARIRALNEAFERKSERIVEELVRLLLG